MKYDPQLHILRSVAYSLEDQRLRAEAVAARNNLYGCLDRGELDEARDWLDALAVSLETADLSNETTKAVDRAIAVIRKGLEAK